MDPHSFHVPGDMYNQEGDDSEPEWVTTEREQFTEFRDKNKDGKMDKDETRDWILPQDYDHAEAEAKHLVYEADSDKVGTSKLHTAGFNKLELVPNWATTPKLFLFEKKDFFFSGLTPKHNKPVDSLA